MEGGAERRYTEAFIDSWQRILEVGGSRDIPSALDVVLGYQALSGASRGRTLDRLGNRDHECTSDR